MFLSQLSVTNFRIFGDSAEEPPLKLTLNAGLNVIVGENDSGKTAVVDAIRLLLGTRDNEWSRINKDDFHVRASGQATKLRIEGVFENLDRDEAAAFLDWLGIRPAQSESDSPRYYLRVWLEAERKDVSELQGRFDREVAVRFRAGPDTEGKRLEGDARDFLRVTYLRPLRDAEQELSARRGSRLSQILLAHPEVREQAKKKDEPGTLIAIVKSANTQISEHPSISGRVDTLNVDYLSNFLLGGDPINAAVNIADPDLRSILERLVMSLVDGRQLPTSTLHGLGLNNLLFVATELLLLQRSDPIASPMLIIEEPEAHLHPQFQLRLMQFLEQQAGRSINATRSIQVIMTSHSPNLASTVDLERLIIMHRGRSYPLASKFTWLDQSDYRFLKRFLDVTKANLFFARGVLLVEGDAEQILLPTLAALIGRPLAKHGVSIVNVGHIGLFRYAGIFQRKDDQKMDVRVACITDLDVPSANSKPYLKKNSDGVAPRTDTEMTSSEIDERRQKRKARPGGEPIRTYVSPIWTLEHDLAASGLALEVHVGIQLAVASRKKHELDDASTEATVANAISQYKKWRREGKSGRELAALVYQPLYLQQASKPEAAQYLADLLESKPWSEQQSSQRLRKILPTYLIEAIDYVTRNDTL